MASKKTKLFQPSTPLEGLVFKGDVGGVIKLMEKMTLAQRKSQRADALKLARHVDEALSAWDDPTHAGWGKRPSEDQRRAVAAAVVVCGSTKDAAEHYRDIGDVITIARKLAPPSIKGLADEIAELGSGGIHDIQALVAAGLNPRPNGDAYVFALMNLLDRHGPRKSFKQLFAQDPGLPKVLLRIMEVEGDSGWSLANIEKYNGPDFRWSTALLKLCADGVYSRKLLLDKTLSGLERPWIQQRVGWFSGFHQKLKPSAAEMKPHTARYLALLGSRIPPTVSLALDALKRLDAEGALDARELFVSLRPVFNSAIKSQVEGALKLLDSAVSRDASRAREAAALVMPALAQPAALLQKQVLARLAAWKPDGEVRKQLGKFAKVVAAVNRKELARLMDDASAKDVATQARQPTPKVSSPKKSHPGAHDARVSALDTGRRVASLEDPANIVERVAYVFENGKDAEAFECALAALVALAPLDESTRSRLAPVAKRIDKVQKAALSRELARILHFLLTAERRPGEPLQAYCGTCGKRNHAETHLTRRVDELMDFAALGAKLTPLATPTHQRGFIDATVLAQRLEALQTRGITPPEMDFATALIRLAPPGDAARAAARRLKDSPAANSLRAALDESGVRGSGPLLDAAARARSAHGSATQAPKAGASKFSLEWFEARSGESFPMFELTATRSDDGEDPVSQIEQDASRGKRDGWYAIHTVGGEEEGSIRYYASLTPADLEPFFFDGARAIAGNLGWWQARWQNAAYLQPLLDPTVTMGPNATMLLALALAGKDPGQTAIAVDALVRSHGELRLDAARLATDVSALLSASLTAPARYAKSLAAALRIDTGVAPAVAQVICAAVAVKPADPPAGTPTLLELLLEIVIDHDVEVDTATRVAIGALALSGKSKKIRDELLAQLG